MGSWKLKLERGAKFILMNKILFSFKLIFLFEEDFFPIFGVFR